MSLATLIRKIIVLANSLETASSVVVKFVTSDVLLAFVAPHKTTDWTIGTLSNNTGIPCFYSWLKKKNTHWTYVTRNKTLHISLPTHVNYYHENINKLNRGCG